ncbi:OLC1v1009138C1 [Oldenlandia corymbosa var. corymbosa]|uniref:OLC1v1009138C1 n=1 Tax=Oldenlandia corymbosa var. corymbosa TaxID=529605 RepID=A0AAV1DR19_OLDCO|nr:OLC1v1009138C1 [Oldenlandia corymbosa var. corymbosa]
MFMQVHRRDIGAGTSGGRTVEDNEDGDEDGDEDEDKDEDKDEDADEDEDVGGVESSDDEYVPSDEDSDDDTDFESSSSVPYVFDDISGWDKTLEEVENDGIKMWDGNPLTLGLDIHFANKPEAQAAVGEWNLVHGRTFRVKTSSKRIWYVECETCGPKYPKERLHGYDCLWKARVSLQKATDTWKMVVWSDSHNCLGANKRNESRNVTSSMIARLVAQNVRKHPDFAVVQIQIEVMKRTGIDKLYDPYGIHALGLGADFDGSPKILGGDLDLSDCPLGTRWSREKKFKLSISGVSLVVPSGYCEVCYCEVSLVVPSGSENARGFHGSAETLRLMATLMEDVRSLSIIGHRTFDADSFGYDRLGEIAQVAERVLSVNATNVVRHDLDRHVEVHDILSQELAPVDPTQQHPPPKPPRRSRRSQHGRGGQERITSSQPHQSSQHEQSHIPFTGSSSHQSPHHSSHQSPHHSSPTQQAFYRPIMSPQHQQSNFSFTQFSSPQTSQRQFGDSFIDFSGFKQSSLDGQSIHYTSNFLSSMFEGVAGQHQADNPAEGERESQGKDEAEDEAEDEDEDEDADQDDQFEGQGYQRHEEQGSSQTLGTPPLAVNKGQRVMKEPDRLTYSLFRAKKPKKK